jgi:hypothetical protein
MATKIFCDACGADSADAGRNRYEYLCHLDTTKMGFCDRNLEPVSGRTIEVDLCNKCYNIVVAPSVAALKKIQIERLEKILGD